MPKVVSTVLLPEAYCCRYLVAISPNSKVKMMGLSSSGLGVPTTVIVAPAIAIATGTGLLIIIDITDITGSSSYASFDGYCLNGRVFNDAEIEAGSAFRALDVSAEFSFIVDSNAFCSFEIVD